MREESIIPVEQIASRIYMIRRQKVMLDRDLAELYGVPTGRLNEQVKRNINRFPSDFMFQLSKKEMEDWKSQIARSNPSLKMSLRKAPLAFLLITHTILRQMMPNGKFGFPLVSMKNTWSCSVPP